MPTFTTQTQSIDIGVLNASSQSAKVARAVRQPVMKGKKARLHLLAVRNSSIVSQVLRVLVSEGAVISQLCETLEHGVTTTTPPLRY